MAHLDATRSVSYLAGIADNVPQLGMPGVGLADREALVPAPPRATTSTSGGEHASVDGAVPRVAERDVVANTTTPGSARGDDAADGPPAPSLWQRLKGYVGALPGRHPWSVLLLKAGLFYADFTSDVLYAILLRKNPDLLGPSNVVIGVLVLPPVALSAMDLYEYYTLDEDDELRGAQMGWKGVGLNLTNTRML